MACYTVSITLNAPLPLMKELSPHPEDVTVPSDPHDLPEQSSVSEEPSVREWKTLMRAHPSRTEGTLSREWQSALLMAPNIEAFLATLEYIDDERATSGGPALEVHPYVLGPSSAELHFSIEMFFKKVLKHVADAQGGEGTYHRPELVVGRFVEGLNMEAIPGVRERLSELLIERYGQLLDAESASPFGPDTVMDINVATELNQVERAITLGLSPLRASLLIEALRYAATHNQAEALACIHYELLENPDTHAVERFEQYGISPQDAQLFLSGVHTTLPPSVLESAGGLRWRARFVRTMLFAGGYFPPEIQQDRLVGLVLDASHPLE